MTTLHLCLTMDVERIAMYSPTGGPRTWEDAERSVRSYCETLAAYDLPATLFIVPDAAMVQGALFRELERSTGAELGMHFHPQCWRDHYLNPAAYEYLGGYAAEQQYSLLAAALEQTSEGLGARPYAFRGGNFSANDSTFAVLADLGFTHGSVSQPGRVAPQYRAVWAGADPDVHRAHRDFRLIAGDLDFVEVPLTSDRTRTNHWTGVGDVRFETASAQEIATAVRQEVQRQIATGAPFLHACLMTRDVPTPESVGFLLQRPAPTDAIGLTESPQAVCVSAHPAATEWFHRRSPSWSIVRAAFASRSCVTPHC